MSETDAPRASASIKLAEVVNHQIGLSQAAKTFKRHGLDIIVVLSADATPLWKAKQLGVTFLSTVGNNQVMQGPLTYGRFGGPCGGVMTHISC